jgi:hypothetical protein
MESFPYKFNFNDLSRFLEDFSYILHKGGATNRLSEKFKFSGSKKAIVEEIIRWVWIFFNLCIIIVVLYTAYIIIFKGYPRVILDVLTFNFFHKEKPDDFLKENNLITDNFKFLSKKTDSCLQPYDIYNYLYENGNGNGNLTLTFNSNVNIIDLINQFEKAKIDYYGKYKYDEQYLNALKEFYLFYDKINIVNPQDVRFENHKITIQQYDAYELLLTYKIIKGEIDTKNPKQGGKKSVDQLMYELYKSEQQKKFISITGIKKIHEILTQLAKEFSKMNNNFITTPVIPYLVIPIDNNAINIILKDFSKMKENIIKKTIYSVPYNQISDGSWYMIEYTMSLTDMNQYVNFVNNLPKFTDDISKIIYYINLPRDQKSIAEKRIVNYTQNSQFFEYIKKRPIFAHIFFSKSIDTNNKTRIYTIVMNSYKFLGDCGIPINTTPLNIDNSTIQKRLINLQKNGYALKQFVNTISYLNLFLNNYRSDLTIMYEKQIISDTRFLKEMWMPFVTDIFINRIGSFTKKTFSSNGMGSSYSRFLKFYKSLGKELNNMIKAVFMAFFTSKKIEQPHETDTGDNTDTSAGA